MGERDAYSDTSDRGSCLDDFDEHVNQIKQRVSRTGDFAC